LQFKTIKLYHISSVISNNSIWLCSVRLLIIVLTIREKTKRTAPAVMPVTPTSERTNAGRDASQMTPTDSPKWLNFIIIIIVLKSILKSQNWEIIKHRICYLLHFFRTHPTAQKLSKFFITQTILLKSLALFNSGHLWQRFWFHWLCQQLFFFYPQRTIFCLPWLWR